MKPPGFEPSLKYTPMFAAEAYNLCLLGYTVKELAEAFNVSDYSISMWQHTYPEFGEAVKAGRLNADAKVARSLYERACGYHYPAVKVFYDKKRKVIVKCHYEKYKDPDARAAIRWLTNRLPHLWGNKVRVEHSGSVEVKNVTITYVDAAQSVPTALSA